VWGGGETETGRVPTKESGDGLKVGGGTLGTGGNERVGRDGGHSEQAEGNPHQRA
jgi:hypothetical protein